MAKKAKRGVKPGTKRGSYRKVKPENKIIVGLRQALAENRSAWKVSEIQVESSMGTPSILTLCEQLEETITRLENRVSNSIARINALIGQI